MVVWVLEKSNMEKENRFGVMIITKIHTVKISLWVLYHESIFLCFCSSSTIVVWEWMHGIDINILFVGSFCMAAGCTRSVDESRACIQIWSINTGRKNVQSCWGNAIKTRWEKAALPLKFWIVGHSFCTLV